MRGSSCPIFSSVSLRGDRGKRSGSLFGGVETLQRIGMKNCG